MISPILIVLLYLISFSKEETGLSLTCDAAIQRVHDSHSLGSALILPNRTSLSPRQFAAVLRKVKRYDFSNDDSISVQQQTCQTLQSTAWQNKSSNSVTKRIEGVIFTTTADTSEWDGRPITIKDYWIHRQLAPKEIYMRVINECIQVLKIDEQTYWAIYEVKPEAYEEAEGKYDLVKKKCP